MSKRKREDEENASLKDVADQALRIRISRLKAKIDQGIKSLTAALRLAKGFERQKLGRRQKESSDAPHTLLRLREEVILLKEIEPAELAGKHLLKQMLKAKRIRESAAFIHLYGTDPKTDTVKSGAEANVLGRLFSSSPVKQVMPDIMNSIFNTLGLDRLPSGNKNSIKARSDQSESEIADSPDGDSFAGFSDSEVAEKNNQMNGVGLQSDEEVLDSFAARVASSEGEETDEEAVEPHNQDRREVQKEDSSNIDHHSLSASSSSSLSSSPARTRLDTSEHQSGAVKSVPAASKTSFLPSLSMGGYYSGSESDDGPAYDQSGLPQFQERKNRRGQAARRRLAELKYGQNAKHLQKQKSTVDREVGWDPKRGAVDMKDKIKNRSGQHRFSRRFENSGAPVGSLGSKSETRRRANGKDDSGKIHPSWEAAKQRKSQSTGQAAFIGKKITFD